MTEQPHTGCAKFVERFGAEAMRFVNGTHGRPLRLRGLNARVLVPGRVRPGDPVTVARPSTYASAPPTTRDGPPREGTGHPSFECRAWVSALG